LQTCVNAVLRREGAEVLNLGPSDGYPPLKQALLEMKSEAERIETLTEYYRITIPKVEKTLLARQRAGGNGRVH